MTVKEAIHFLETVDPNLLVISEGSTLISIGRFGKNVFVYKSLETGRVIRVGEMIGILHTYDESPLYTANNTRSGPAIFSFTNKYLEVIYES